MKVDDWFDHIGQGNRAYFGDLKKRYGFQVNYVIGHRSEFDEDEDRFWSRIKWMGENIKGHRSNLGRVGELIYIGFEDAADAILYKLTWGEYC